MFEVSAAAYRDPSIVLPPPPVHPWFVKGPRGGLFIATGEIKRATSNAYGDAFIRNTIVVKDESEGARYVRPGSRLARQYSDVSVTSPSD
jgi:hypothetical protein